MKKIIFLFSALMIAPAACSDDSVTQEPEDGGTDAKQVDSYVYVDKCPLDREERLHVAAATSATVNDLFSAASTAAQGKYGIYLSLLGTSHSVRQSLTLSVPCSHEQELNVNCLSDDDPDPAESFFQERDECIQFVCEGENLFAVRVYYTMLDHREFDDPHEFTYPGDLIYGDEFVWNPNPSVVWRYDERTDGRVLVSADMDRNVTVLFEERDSLNLKHEGTAETVIIGAAIDSVNLDLSFPNMSAGSVEVSVNADSEGEPEGTIMLNGDVLAEYRTSGITWVGECAP